MQDGRVPPIPRRIAGQRRVPPVQSPAPYPLPTIHYPLSFAAGAFGPLAIWRRFRRRRCPSGWARTACGGSGWRAARIAGPLVPDLPEKRYEASLDLEWPVEGLEPLSFVLGPAVRAVVRRAGARRSCGGRAARGLHAGHARGRDAHPAAAGAHARSARPAHARPARPRGASGHGRDRSDRGDGRSRAGPDRAVLAAGPRVAGSRAARAASSRGWGRSWAEERVGAAALVDSHRPEAFQMTPFTVRGQAGIRG